MRLAVRQEEVPVRIDVPHVPDRARLATVTTRGRRLRRVTEVLEVGRPAEPHRPRLADGTLAPLVVEDQDLTQDTPPHDPGCANQSSESMNVAPFPSVAA